MGKFNGVLLVSDFDDTLYGSDLRVSEENRRALDYFTGAGGIFTVATGRAHPTFAPHAASVPINAPVVLSNGACLYDFQADRVVRETFLPRRAARDLQEVARRFPEIGFEAYHQDEIYAYQPNEVTFHHLRRAQAAYTERPILEMPLPWTKAILQQRNPLLRSVQRYILERWAEHYEAIFSNAVLLELTAKGSTKGGMVRCLARLLGIEERNIYCVGDNQNDIPMLAVSAIPFAPSNCAQEVRGWGARILSSCDESCVAQIVAILDKRY